ncbi:MAG: hypothetical protein C4518_04940 [Desulfobacteraceae bacterium]|jgi:hypothetical protein|nr:MAG: hypothetical protein C4518_04940 [Desulfobacteraceae bacterium]
MPDIPLVKDDDAQREKYQDGSRRNADGPPGIPCPIHINPFRQLGHIIDGQKQVVCEKVLLKQINPG